MRRPPSLVFGLLLLTAPLLGQSRQVTLPNRADTLRIDTLSIVPASWGVTDQDGKPLADSLFSIDWVNGLLILTDTTAVAGDSLRVAYDPFPLRLNRVYQNKSPDFNRIDPPLYRPPLSRTGQEAGGGLSDALLQSSGSLSRGLSVGNRRDASLTSNLNLQIQGQLNRDFLIEATLTDANIPVQPEGNTHQIQEFDRVYLRIYNPRNEILGGDFEMTATESHFLRMNKKVQGVRYTTRIEPESGRYRLTTSTGAAVVKGKYTRNRIDGREGNQGPYVLTGAAGESYIQIIAGSEMVYIDGIPMARGEDADYVIDYNTAEIRFTPKRLITKDKRIQVEFEYTERSYSRFLAYNETHWTGSRGSWFVNLLTESDARNQPLLQDLTDANREILGLAGDQAEQARVNTIRESAFRNDRVFYRMTDTLVNQMRYDSVLVYSTNADSARFEATFSFVGRGNGHYEPVSSSANGRVFKWIAPVNGVRQGSYEPMSRLVAPVSKQVITAGTRQALGQRMLFDLEWALTRNDLNTFSPLDDEDNLGLGLNAGLRRTDQLRPDSALVLRSFINYRHTGARFDPVERFREVEFERDWNLGMVPGTAPEHFLVSGMNLAGGDSLRGGYRMEYLNRGPDYSGFRQYTDGRLAAGRWEAGWSGSYLASESPLGETRFLRHNLSLKRAFGPVSLEVGENAEDNRWLRQGSDSLLPLSAAFQEVRLLAGLGSGEVKPWTLRVQHRTDRAADTNHLEPVARAWEAESWVNLSKKTTAPFRAGISWRALSADSTRLTSGENGQSLTGRIDTRFQAWKGLVRLHTFYEVGSGFERKPEYTYLEVAAGQGYYTWVDYNNNNIKELDEFEPAWFQDQASFVRIFRLGNEFIPILVNRFNQVLTIQPRKGFLSKFGSQLAYRIDKKNLRDDYLSALNPFTGRVADPRLLSLNSQIRHTFSFNKANPKFNMELISQRSAVRTTLINGAEGRTDWSHTLFVRYRFHPAWQVNSQTGLSDRASVSEYFPGRNFGARSRFELLQATWQPGDALRLGFDWEIRQETGSGPTGANLLSNRVESSITGQIPDKGQVTGSLQYLYIRFDGNAASPEGYSLLRGFNPGHNGIARLSLRHKLGRNLVAEAVYEGRISTMGRMVHNAQVQVRAIF
ncbi:MAG: hypothetical protein R6V75_00155 [Bacteroidales bacterium]